MHAKVSNNSWYFLWINYSFCLFTGDSGGGFVSSRILYGIISSGNGCAKPGFPGIYTNVFAVKDFVIMNSFANI